MASNDPTEALNSYITDMLSVERHINAALESQIKDLDNYPTIVQELRNINATVESHIQTLENLADKYGGEKAAGTIKKVGAALAGLAAGAIDMVRNEALPKNLRDDYTAFSLATVSYLMLHTTAVSLGDRLVGDVAQRHFANYAEIVTRLHNLIPAAVVEFLQEEGLPAREDVLPEIAQTVEAVWQQQSQKPPKVDQVEVR